MNIQEVQNNIDIVLKPFDNKELNAKQQHAKDTLTAAHLMISKLCEVIEEKDEHLKINYQSCIEKAISLKEERNKTLTLEKEIRELKEQLNEFKSKTDEMVNFEYENQIAELKKQIEELKK